MPTFRTFLVLAGAAAFAFVATPALRAADVGVPAEETAASLIGAPVFSADGRRIGDVADVATNDAGEPERIRFATGNTLGIGARTLELPQDSFSVLRGAVVVNLPAEALPDLAHSTDRDEGN